MHGRVHAVFLFLLLALAGCAGPPTHEQRLLCQSLTDYAQPGIPRCATPDSCRTAIDRAFPLDTDAFDFSVARGLAQYKAHLAVVWLRFNEAKIAIDEIRKGCQTANDFGALRKNVNELNRALLSLFNELDAATPLALNLIALERNALDEERVEQIADTELFRVFEEFSLNTSEAAYPDVPKKQYTVTYALQQQANQFRQLSNHLGFHSESVAEFSFGDAVDQFDEALFGFLPKEKFEVRLLKPVLQFLIPQLNDARYLNEVVYLLQQTSARELFVVLDGYAAPQNSVAATFFGLFQRDARERLAIQAENEALFKEISLLARESVVDDVSMPSNPATASVSYLSRAFQAQARPPTVSSSAAVSVVRTPLPALHQQWHDIQRRHATNQLPLGEANAELRKLKNSWAKALAENVAVTQRSQADYLVLCQARLGLLTENLKEIPLENLPSRDLMEQRSRINSHLKAFNATESTEKKLAFCADALREWDSFKAALATAAQQPVEAEQATCLQDIEIFLQANPNPGAVEQLRQLQTKHAAGEPVDCAALKQSLFLSLHADSDYASLLELLSLIQSRLETLSALSTMEPGLAGTQDSSKHEKALHDLTTVATIRENGLPGENVSSLLQRARALHAELVTALQKALPAYFAGKETLSLASLAETVANRPVSREAVLQLFNPFPEINVPFTLPLSLPKAAWQHSGGAATLQQTGETHKLNVQRLAPGDNFLYLSASDVVVSTTEKETVVSASAQKAVLRKTIAVNAPGNIPVLLVPTTLIGNPIEFVALHNGKPLEASLDGTILTVRVPDAYSKQSLEVIYSVPNPVTVETVFDEATELEPNRSRQSVSFTVSNRLPRSLDNAEVLLPLSLPNATEKISVTNEAGKTVKAEAHPLQGLSVTLPSLAPLQSTRLTASFLVEDVKAFWGTQTAFLLGRLEPLLSLPDGALATEAAKQREALSGATVPTTLAEAAKKLSDVEKGVARLENNAQTVRAAEQRLAWLNGQLAQQTQAFDAAARDAADLGFQSFAETASAATKTAADGFARAEALLKNGNAKEAEKLAADALKAVSKLPDSELLSLVEREGKRLITEAKPFLSTAEAGTQKRFLESERLLAQALSTQNLAQAKTALNRLQATVTALLEQATGKTEQSQTSLTDSIAQLQTALARIQSLKQKTDQLLAASSEKPETKEFLQQQGRAHDALAKRLETLQSRSPPTTSADAAKQLDHAAQLEADYSALFSRFREKAYSAYNFAAAKANLSEENPEATGLLLQAKTALDAEAFVQATEAAEAALGLLEFKENAQPFTVPLAAYPLLLIIGTVLFFRFRAESKKQNQPPLKRLPRL